MSSGCTYGIGGILVAYAAHVALFWLGLMAMRRGAGGRYARSIFFFAVCLPQLLLTMPWSPLFRRWRMLEGGWITAPNHLGFLLVQAVWLAVLGVLVISG